MRVGSTDPVRWRRVELRLAHRSRSILPPTRLPRLVARSFRLTLPRLVTLPRLRADACCLPLLLVVSVLGQRASRVGVRLGVGRAVL
eukprot:3002555-Rhodomonas_salina.3